jgi:hypothetical protein
LFFFVEERDEWSVVEVRRGETPSPRRSHCAVVYGNAMYVWGGYSGTENCKPLLHKFDFGMFSFTLPFEPKRLDFIFNSSLISHPLTFRLFDGFNE